MGIVLVIYEYLFSVKEEQKEHMGSFRAPLLVSTQWLKQQLTNPSLKLRLLDATWSPIAGGYSQFVQ